MKERHEVNVSLEGPPAAVDSVLAAFVEVREVEGLTTTFLREHGELGGPGLYRFVRVEMRDELEFGTGVTKLAWLRFELVNTKGRVWAERLYATARVLGCTQCDAHFDERSEHRVHGGWRPFE